MNTSFQNACVTFNILAVDFLWVEFQGLNPTISLTYDKKYELLSDVKESWDDVEFSHLKKENYLYIENYELSSFDGRNARGSIITRSTLLCYQYYDDIVNWSCL